MNSHKFENHGITVSIVNFSPAKALRILDTINVGNRKVSRSRVEQYKRDIVNGEWLFNGDAIRIDEDGVLIDGQHRLTAISASGVDCELLVIEGIKSKSKHTIDTGKGRTGGDALSIQAGVAFADSHVMNGAIAAYVKYKRSGYANSSGGLKMTNAEVLIAYSENKMLVDSSLRLMKSTVSMKGLLMQKVDILFLFMIFSEIDLDDAKYFLSKIFTGAEVPAGSTEMHIRDILIECKTGSRKSNKKIIINSVIKCWNTIRRGGQIKHKNNCMWRPTADKSPIAS